MCLTSHWPIIFNISQFLRMRVTNWSNNFVDQGQFSDTDFFRDTHQKENVQFANNVISHTQHAHLPSAEGFFTPKIALYPQNCRDFLYAGVQS
jgi:hypothetical protein